MDEITTKRLTGERLAVYLGKKRVGSVVMLGKGQYQYRPKGSTHLNGGEIFPSTLECLASLRTESTSEAAAK